MGMIGQANAGPKKPPPEVLAAAAFGTFRALAVGVAFRGAIGGCFGTWPSLCNGFGMAGLPGPSPRSTGAGWSLSSIGGAAAATTTVTNVATIPNVIIFVKRLSA